MRGATTCGAVALALLGLVLSPAAAQDQPNGVVLVLGAMDGTAALESARQVGGAQWRLEALSPEVAPALPSVEEALGSLQAAYGEGDFPRCLTELQDPELDESVLLARGQSAEVARLLVLTGACIAGAGDPARARAVFERAFSWEIGADELVATLRPDIQAIAEDARQVVVARRRVRLVVRAPRGAEVSVNGRTRDCDATECVLSMPPGDHVIGLRALGRADRTQRGTFSADADVTLSMDVVDPTEGAAQLRHALEAGIDAESLEFARAAADTFGARVLVILRSDGERIRASVYDRARGRIDARQSERGGAGSAARLTRNVILEWRGEIETGPGWWVWAVVGGSVLVAGIATYLLVRPELTDHTFQFEAGGID